MRDSFARGGEGRTPAKATQEGGWSQTTSMEGDLIKWWFRRVVVKRDDNLVVKVDPRWCHQLWGRLRQTRLPRQICF